MQKVAPHREEPLLGRNAHSARYGELIHDMSVHYQEQAYSENFVMGSDAAEFVNKVKDQVRNRQKRMSNVAELGDEHSIIWRMFMATTLNAATFMGKNFSTIQSFVKNHESLTLRQMFDVTDQLVNNQDEIKGLDKILWEKFLDTSVINWWWDSHQSVKHESLCLLGFCVVPWKGSSTSRIQRSLEEQSCRNPIRKKATDIMMLSTESRLNSSGTFSQDSQRCSFVIKSIIFWALLDKHQNLSQEEFYLCQCSMTSPVTEKTTKMNAWQMSESWKYCGGPGCEKNGFLLRTVHKEPGIILRSKCCWNLQKVGILISGQQLHCPGVLSKAKSEEN